MIKSLKQYIERIERKPLITVLIILAISITIAFAKFIIIDPSFKTIGDHKLALMALFALTSLLNLTLYFYIKKTSPKDRHILRTMSVVFASVTLTVLLSFVIKEYVHYYAMPIAICGVIIVLLQDKRIAIFATVITAQIIFVAFSVTAIYQEFLLISDAIAVITAMASGLFIVYFINQNYTRIKLITIALITGVVMGIFAALATSITAEGAHQIFLSAFWTVVGNILSITLVLVLMPLIERIFGLATNFSLMELCSFDNPVLKRLKDEAPGTFNHSLVVGNLSEHCALAIGKNPVLARAAAYYHDVGKLIDPEYYVENQISSYNPHDELIPEVSVRKITMHTDEGYKLLKKHDFPKIIIDVAREHHGDSPLQFFYFKAQNITEGELLSDTYRYSGPKPQSVTAAIVMIADIVEATSRTKGAMSSTEVNKMIDTLIKEKINLGQFDECDITMNDLNIIKRTIANVLPGIYHGRLSYPEKKE